MCSIRERRSISLISCVPTRIPSRSTVTRSHSSKTSSSRCDTKITLRPCATRSRVALNTRSISGLLSVAVGSSRMSRRASRTSRRAISTSWRSPIERVSTGVPRRTWPEPELVEDAPGLLGEASLPVEEGHVEPPEEDVVLDAELRHEAQLLVHERDPVRLGLVRVAERELLAVEADHPLVGPDEADEGLHEGALAGPVVPADRMHLADPDVERKAPDRLDRAVRLGEVDDLQEHRSGRSDRQSENGIRAISPPDPVLRSSNRSRSR